MKGTTSRFRSFAVTVALGVRRQLSFRIVLPQRRMLPEKAGCLIGRATWNAQLSGAQLSIPCCGVYLGERVGKRRCQTIDSQVVVDL